MKNAVIAGYLRSPFTFAEKGALARDRWMAASGLGSPVNRMRVASNRRATRVPLAT